jgi:hypothetical protein
LLQSSEAKEKSKQRTMEKKKTVPRHIRIPSSAASLPSAGVPIHVVAPFGEQLVRDRQDLPLQVSLFQKPRVEDHRRQARGEKTE